MEICREKSKKKINQNEKKGEIIADEKINHKIASRSTLNKNFLLNDFSLIYKIDVSI